MRRLLMFIPVALAVALGIVLFAGIGKDPTRLESALVGKPVPAFELQELQNPDSLYHGDIFKGQVTLLNVWGTWCPSCREEHGDLLTLSRDLGVRIVGLNYKDSRDAALEWLDNLGNPYALSLYDPEGELGFDLGVYGAPETFVIDADGIVRYRHVGVIDQKAWMDTLEPLVRQYGGQG